MRVFLRIVGVCYICWLYMIQILLFTYRCNNVTSLKLHMILIYSSSHPLFPFGVSIPCSSPNGSSSSSSTGFFITDCLDLPQISIRGEGCVEGRRPSVPHWFWRSGRRDPWSRRFHRRVLWSRRFHRRNLLLNSNRSRWFRRRNLLTKTRSSQPLCQVLCNSTPSR